MRLSDVLSFSTNAAARRESSRLADLVDPAAVLDVATLSALCVMGLPTTLGETPYRDISCSLQGLPEEGPAGDRAFNTPWEAAAGLRRALDDTIDRAVGAARRVAVLTGGGLDSAGLLALATAWAQRAGGTAFGVALDFAGDGDDRPHLAALQARLGCEVLRVSPEDAADRIALVRAGVDAIPCTAPTAPMEIELMARARANGAEVVLMGVGGDELFDGNPRSLASMARGGQIYQAVRAARGLRGFATPRSPVASWVVRPLLAACVPRALRIARARRSSRRPAPAWAGPRLAAYFAMSRARDLDSAARRIAVGEDPTTKSTDLAYRHYLAWGRHVEQVGAGVERVDPYLDRTLIRQVERLPGEWLLHGGRRRGLFRESMRGLLPDSLRLRDDKASFEPALVRFVRAAGGLASLDDAAHATQLGDLGIVDRRAFRAAFEAFRANPADEDAWTTVWPALCVESFLRERTRR